MRSKSRKKKGRKGNENKTGRQADRRKERRSDCLVHDDGKERRRRHPEEKMRK